MKKTCFSIFILLGGLLFFLSGSEDQNTGTEAERFKQYLIGVKYLETAQELSQEEKIAYYKKLVELTDFSAEKAQTYLKQYEDNPEKWEKVISSVISILDKSDTLNKE